ncbi:hypothetical protein [Collinsella sp. i05-0019-G5]
MRHVLRLMPLAALAALLAWAARSAWALAVVLTVPVRLACG